MLDDFQWRCTLGRCGWVKLIADSGFLPELNEFKDSDVREASIFRSRRSSGCSFIEATLAKCKAEPEDAYAGGRRREVPIPSNRQIAGFGDRVRYGEDYGRIVGPSAWTSGNCSGPKESRHDHQTSIRDGRNDLPLAQIV